MQLLMTHDGCGKTCLFFATVAAPYGEDSVQVVAAATAYLPIASGGFVHQLPIEFWYFPHHVSVVHYKQTGALS